MCSPASACPTSSSSSITGGGGGRVRPDPPRRSRSQGTRKLHKCLSTASYSEDCGSHIPCTATPSASTAQRQQQLLVARQYCSFGSTVTKIISNHRTHAYKTIFEPDCQFIPIAKQNTFILYPRTMFISVPNSVIKLQADAFVIEAMTLTLNGKLISHLHPGYLIPYRKKITENFYLQKYGKFLS